MNEFEIINILTRDAPGSSDVLKTGVGDDCAVIAGGDCDWLLTTDSLFERVHFDFVHTTDRLLGRKSLSVNLSDVAAMGGEPLFYTVNLGVPAGHDVSRLRDLYAGMADVGREAGVILIGGDTCRSASGLVISITVLGRTGKGRAILRSTAKPGDFIYAGGTYGEAKIGLECFKRGATDEKFTPYVRRLNDPKARLGFGSWLAGTGMVTSMIDVSDGLLADLGHIADSSGVGFEVEAESVPTVKGFTDVAKEFDLDPFETALTGGEDYELIFTVSAKGSETFDKLLANSNFGSVYPVKRIGIITKNPNDRFVRDEKGSALTFKNAGYDHFSG